MDSLSEKQQIACIKFSAILRGEEEIAVEDIPDDQVLRFFVEYKFNPELATKAVKDSIIWRKQQDFNSMARMDMSKFAWLEEKIPHGFFGTDSNFRPIRFLRVTSFDFDEMLEKYTEQELIDYNVIYMERIVGMVFKWLEKNKKSDFLGMISVVDIKDFSMVSVIGKSKIIDLGKKISAILSANYPQTTERIFVVNSGILFSTLFSLIQSILPESTVEKIKIYNNDYLPELLKFTTLERIPKCLGGTFEGNFNEFENPWDPSIREAISNGKLSL